MKRFLILLMTILLTLPLTAVASEMLDVHEHPSCSYCGMKRGMFSHSRMLITYADESQFAACSLHCAALDFANQIDKAPKSIEVADYNSKKLIDAESAPWVVGGKVKGVMTARPKWAFADNKSAEEFVAANGGDITDFDAAIKAAFEDMYHDTKMIRKKRAKMKMMKKDGGHSHTHQ